MEKSEYPITTENGTVFCKCRCENGEIKLVNKSGTITLRSLIRKVNGLDVKRTRRTRRKRRAPKVTANADQAEHVLGSLK